MVEVPVRVLLLSAEWFLFLNESRRVHALEWELVAAFVRLYRLYDLWQYFSSREKDVATDIRWVAAFKFAFIIFTTVRSSFYFCASHAAELEYPWMFWESMSVVPDLDRLRYLFLLLLILNLSLVSATDSAAGSLDRMHILRNRRSRSVHFS